MEVTVIPDIKQEARTMAQQVLSRSASFQSMPLEEQRTLYLDLVNENMDKLSRQYALDSDVKKLANKGQGNRMPSGAEMGFEGYNPGFEESTKAFDELVDSVDFPQFVADLLKAVFDANLSVMKQQTDAYIKLMKEATKSVAEFVTKVSQDDAVAKLAEEKPDMYNIAMDDTAEGDSKLALTTPQGEKVDMEDNEVKAKIMEMKIAMAKEHRAALREVILMGVTRLVVKKGVVEAGVEFNITAKRTSDKSNKSTNVNTVNAKTGFGGGIGSLFGGPSASLNVSNTNINVSTSNKKAEDTLTAKLMGKVNIEFATDYFKLDNFLEMYGAGGIAQLNRGNGQQPTPMPGTAPGLPGK